MACVTEGQAVPDGWSIMCEAGTQGRETGGLTPGKPGIPPLLRIRAPVGDQNSDPPSLCLCFCR